MPTFDTIIIGAGISGLTAAFKLKQKKQTVLVLEKTAEPGGNIKTNKLQNFLCETGPHSFMGANEFTWALIQELELTEKVIPAKKDSNNRYIYKNNHLYALPLSFLSFISTQLLSPVAKFRLALEPFIKGQAKDNDTAWDFFCRRFGKEAATYIMSPFVSGIYAGNVKELGAKAAFPKFWQFEKDKGSMIKGAFSYMRQKKKRLKQQGKPYKKGLFSFNEGLGKITQTLSQKINNDIITNTNITSIQFENNIFTVTANNKSYQSNNLILATPPQKTANLIKDITPLATELLNQIPMAPVVLVHWSLPLFQNRFPKGFGFLIPKKYPLRLLGTLIPSDIFNNRAPKKFAQFASFYGGRLDPEFIHLSDNEIIDLLKKEHSEIIKTHFSDINIIKIMRYSHAIPQLLPQHTQTISDIKKITQTIPGLYLAGNYLTGVGIEHAIQSGYKAAEKNLSDISVGC